MIRFISLSKMTCKVTTKFSNMQTKEEKICSFTQNGTRLQLLKITEAVTYATYEYTNMGHNVRYQVRLNRKIISTTISEYVARKVFASYCQNIVLQLKIY